MCMYQTATIFSSEKPGFSENNKETKSISEFFLILLSDVRKQVSKIFYLIITFPFTREKLVLPLRMSLGCACPVDTTSHNEDTPVTLAQ